MIHITTHKGGSLDAGTCLLLVLRLISSNFHVTFKIHILRYGFNTVAGFKLSKLSELSKGIHVTICGVSTSWVWITPYGESCYRKMLTWIGLLSMEFC